MRNDRAIGPIWMYELYAVNFFNEKVHLMNVKVVHFVANVEDAPFFDRADVDDEHWRIVHLKCFAVDKKLLSSLAEDNDALRRDRRKSRGIDVLRQRRSLAQLARWDGLSISAPPRRYKARQRDFWVAISVRASIVAKAA